MLDWLTLSSAARTVSARWVSLDLETSGLDARTDHIVEVGAVGLHHGAILLGDSFHRISAEGGSLSGDNRVLHGVSAAEQREGRALTTLLAELLAWMQEAPLVGFHTPFDLGFLRAALAPRIGAKAARGFGRDYLDLAVIAPVVFPKIKARSLAEWAAALNLPVRKQHRAMVDALATAHLLQRVCAALPQEERSFQALKLKESARRWL